MSIRIAPLLRVMGIMLFASAGGCMLVAAALDKLGPDPVESAKFVPKQETMLVMVEDYQNPALIEIEAEHINRMIGESLIAHKVAPIINPDHLTVMRSERGHEFRKVKIPTVGSELGARQVLYADVTDFSVQSVIGTDAMKAHAEARVKLVDCITGQTLWPKESLSTGFPVVVDMPFAPESHIHTESALRNALATELAAHIGKLFYNATVSQPDPAPSYPETDLR